MKGQYNRPLNNSEVTSHFVKNILDITSEDEILEISNKIIDIETKLSKLSGNGTYENENERKGYTDRKSRERLRRIIVRELLEKKRVENDDLIELGVGGACPLKEKKAEKKAYIIMGSPASGKSRLVNEISDELGAMVLDTDYAKRKLPEFKIPDVGDDLVHKEASIINKDLLEECMVNNYNLITPKIGNDLNAINMLVEVLHGNGYEVNLTLVCLDRKKVTKRAYERYIKTKRYTPLSLIFDTFSNDTIVTYYKIRDNKKIFSYGKLSSEFGDTYTYIESSSPHNPAEIYKKKKEENFGI